MKITFVTFLFFAGLSTTALCQKSAMYFGQPMFTDSLSTMFFPIRYNDELLSNNKIALLGDYYANIIAYNFTTDSYKTIFEKDTFIESIRNSSYDPPAQRPVKFKNFTARWIFLVVKPTDTNGNGRIDERDPSVLFAVSLDGQTRKQLTSETENVVSFDNYEKQGILLLKIQKDSDNDRSFRNEDREFYYRTVKLKDLSLGKGIDLN